MVGAAGQKGEAHALGSDGIHDTAWHSRSCEASVRPSIRVSPHPLLPKRSPKTGTQNGYQKRAPKASVSLRLSPPKTRGRVAARAARCGRMIIQQLKKWDIDGDGHFSVDEVHQAPQTPPLVSVYITFFPLVDGSPPGAGHRRHAHIHGTSVGRIQSTHARAGAQSRMRTGCLLSRRASISCMRRLRARRTRK